jgi:hypothetical protein
MNDNDLLTSAANRISEELGLTSKPADVVSVINLWMGLHKKMGSNSENILHWMNTYNKHLGYIPGLNVDNKERLAEMVAYLKYEH